MGRLVALVIAGTVTGSIYSLVAVGLVIIYRATNVLNFAHGFLVALAAFLTLEIAQHAAIAVAVAAIPAILIVVVLGLAIERFIVRPISGERPLTIVVATLGVSLILEGIITRQWGSVFEAFPPLISGTAFQLSGFFVSWNQVLVVSVSLCLILLLALFFQVSNLGLSMRATSENKTVAKLLGINPNLVSATSWGLAACVGGIAAIFAAPQVSLSPDAFNTLMIQGFVAVVLAGFTSVSGAIVGGYLSGIGLNLFAGYVTSQTPETFLFVLLLLVLMVRPNGLFGKAQHVHL